jgi:hypothetical protein
VRKNGRIHGHRRRITVRRMNRIRTSTTKDLEFMAALQGYRMVKGLP